MDITNSGIIKNELCYLPLMRNNHNSIALSKMLYHRGSLIRMNRDKVGAVVIVLFSFVAVLLYSWHYFSNIRIEKCKPNVQILIQKCSVAGKNKSNLIVQECEFKNISKYPITIGYSPGKFYQRFWSYDINGAILDRGKPIADFPEVLASKAIAKGRITYRSDAKRVIVCPLDPSKFEEVGVASL